VKFAAIDIGSNAVRLLLARVIEEGDEPLFKKEVLVRMPLRLGDDAFRAGAISEAMTERLVETMVGFRHLITAYPAMDFAAYATSAMREARNSRDVVARVRKAAGITIEVIEGAREAEVVYANHIEHRLDPKKNYLYVDVGGGSTEVSLIARGKRVGDGSFSVGTVRMLRGRPVKRAMDGLKKWIKEHREQYGPMTAIGSGGNINTIFKLARVKQGRPLTFDTVRDIHRLVHSHSLEERVVTLGLRPDRADVIVYAAEVYLSVMKWGRIDTIFVPQVGLSDGIVHLLYERHRRARVLA
jgi:exopolyphosphatase / guanosine-5'-triphosphate,3'-diphosphate pyrophosphatase